ncbi:hypothetical protein SDC9_201080 [bioreactor metagenome]|uniref:Antitoxin n=1 Tax=bioreactor metagenome TaxID=1076179 RepID=A0A645IQP2_9ZZZZ
MKYSIGEFAERLISVSDFSQGKAGKIISEVAENNSEYIIMKNNQPTAVLISLKEYNGIQDKIASLERQQFDSEICLKLKEAELEAKTTGKRLTHEEVFPDLRSKLLEKAAEDV